MAYRFSRQGTMAIDTIYNRILGYFENEVDAARNQLETGQFKSFKDQVIAGRKISNALELLAPYVRQDKRARQLVRNGEAVIRDLLSVRQVIQKHNDSPQCRQLLLICQVMAKRSYLQ